MDEERYFAADMHYDIEEAEALEDLRRLFRQFLRDMLIDGLRDYKIFAPGKYGKRGGKFIFKGVLKRFSYELNVTPIMQEE